MEEKSLNQWDIQLRYWCPAQIYYYFVDAEGGRWCIYLRWRHQDPWTAELVPCDEDWKFIRNSPDIVDLLEEKEHTPGILTGYFMDDEYPELMKWTLSRVKSLRPEFNQIIDHEKADK